MTAAALPERIARHITIQANGCWSWDRLNWAGYGCPVGIHGHYAVPHRVVYELLVGPIRSNSGGWQRRLTECVRGHRFTPENTYVCPRGKRECRTCRNAASRRHKNRRKAA